MKPRIRLSHFVLTFLIYFNATGQSNINWMGHIGGLYTDRAQHVVSDNNGSIFVCGQFSDIIEVQGQTYTSMGLMDGLLIKADTLGNTQWVKQWKGPKDEQLIRMQWFSPTQLIISGTFSDSLLYDNQTVYSLGFDDAFIASVNPQNGSLNWISTAGTYYGYEFIGGLCVTNHRIFWSVNYSSTLYMGNETFTCNGAYDFVTCEVDSNGVFINPIAYHGSGVDLVSSIAADNDGRLFVCGKFNDELSAGNVIVQSNGMFDIFYLSQYSDGSLAWLKSDGGYSTEVANAIAIGQNNDVYMGCWMQDSMVFQDSIMLPDPSGEIFVVKLDYEGNKQWLFRGFPDSGADQITDITISCKGDILFTGLTTYFADITPEIHAQNNNDRNERCVFGDTYIAKLNTNGDLLWLKNTLGTNSNLGMGIAADKYGKIYISGYFTDSLYAGIFKIKGNGGNDFMFFMLNDNEKCFSQPVSALIAANSEFNVFPNPSNGASFIQIHINQPCIINVIDVNGRKVGSASINSASTLIPVHEILNGELSAGIYMIQCITGDHLKTLRWVYLR